MAQVDSSYASRPVELPDKINRENVDFQHYLLRCKPTIPQGCYTDKVFKNEFVNSSLIRLNKIVVFLFYNCINASLQSGDTITRRRMFLAFETANRNKLKLEENKLSAEKPQTIMRNTEANDQQESQLSFPHRNKLAFVIMVCLQLLIWLHYMMALFVLKNPHNKKYGLTSSKNLETYQTLVEIEDKPFSLWSDQLMSDTNATTVPLASCLSNLEAYILDRYDKFYVWNMSVQWSSVSPLVEDYLLVEQSLSLQMFSDEVTLFCHTIGLFLITSGIMGCVLAECKPYDIAAMVFIYDPKYTIYHIKSRLRHYFNIMRVSYKNYWSIYHIDDNQGLCKCLSNRLARQDRPGEITVQADDSCPSNSPTSVYHAEQFDEYIPSARGKTWRQVLMIASPTYQVVTSSIVAATLGVLYILFVAKNDGATELNQELKQFLETDAEPRGFGEIFSRHCASSNNQAIDDEMRVELSNYVRWKMIEYLSDILRQLSPDLSMLKLHEVDQQLSSSELMDLRSLTPSTSIRIHTNAIDYERDPLMQMHKRLVVEALAPIKKPLLLNWTVPYISGFMAGLLFSLYFAIFFSVIVDLCFWLFGIRMKLDTCKVLLKHYDRLSHQNKQTNSQAFPPIWEFGVRRPSGGSTRSYDTFTSIITEEIPCNQVGQDDLSRNLRATRPPRLDSISGEFRRLNKEIISNCNTGFWQVMHYVISDRSRQRAMCASYAKHIIQTDSKLGIRVGLRDFKQVADSFLLSAYLDFRLFLEQIETCRFSINFMLGYTVLHALNLIASSHFTEPMRSKIGFLGCGYVLANITLIGSSFFQSQCTKLISPIYSILASSLNGDKTIKHLSSLWRRALIDLSGSRSKFTFRVYSVNISYTTALQFNLGVTSLYILTLDKMRFRS